MQIPGGMTIEDYNQDSNMMNSGQRQEAGPHVEFELIPVEDREQSMKQGRKIMKDQEFIFIHQRGGKDVVQKKIPEAPKEGEYPSFAYNEFKDRFGRHYEAWKRGQELPVDGTDLRTFPLLTPAQIENCRASHIFTVEQLAETTEEGLANMGMGSRNWKSTAQRWLDFGNNGGKQVTQIENLEAKNQTLEDQLVQLTAKLEEVESQMKKSKKDK